MKNYTIVRASTSELGSLVAEVNRLIDQEYFEPLGPPALLGDAIIQTLVRKASPTATTIPVKVAKDEAPEDVVNIVNLTTGEVPAKKRGPKPKNQ